MEHLLHKLHGWYPILLPFFAPRTVSVCTTHLLGGMSPPHLPKSQDIKWSYYILLFWLIKHKRSITSLFRTWFLVNHIMSHYTAINDMNFIASSFGTLNFSFGWIIDITQSLFIYLFFWEDRYNPISNESLFNFNFSYCNRQ